MLKITDTVKVISKTNCGGIMKELIPVGAICVMPPRTTAEACRSELPNL